MKMVNVGALKNNLSSYLRNVRNGGAAGQVGFHAIEG